MITRVARSRLDAAGLRVPDVLMQLELQARIQIGCQQPFRKLHRPHQAECGAQQDEEALVQLPVPDRFDGPIEIPPGSKYELDLVCRFQAVKIGPAIASAFTTIRALQVHDNVDPTVNACKRVRSARLEQYPLAAIGEIGHEA